MQTASEKEKDKVKNVIQQLKKTREKNAPNAPRSSEELKEMIEEGRKNENLEERIIGAPSLGCQFMP